MSTMGHDRSDLQDILETITPNVYFQPPANVQMAYPAIVYHRDTGSTSFANNKPYSYEQRYEMTLISRDPDEVLHAAIRALPKTSHARFYVADNLNHDVFSIYF